MYFLINNLRIHFPTKLVTDKKTATNIQVNFITVKAYSCDGSIFNSFTGDHRLTSSRYSNFASGALCISWSCDENYEDEIDRIIKNFRNLLIHPLTFPSVKSVP